MGKLQGGGGDSDENVEGIEEMMSNPELMKMINSEVNTKPQVVVTDGTEAFMKQMNQQQQPSTSEATAENLKQTKRIQEIVDKNGFEGFDSFDDLLASSPSTAAAAAAAKGGSAPKGVIDAEYEESN